MYNGTFRNPLLISLYKRTYWCVAPGSRSPGTVIVPLVGKVQWDRNVCLCSVRASYPARQILHGVTERSPPLIFYKLARGSESGLLNFRVRKWTRPFCPRILRGLGRTPLKKTINYSKMSDFHCAYTRSLGLIGSWALEIPLLVF